VSSWSSWGTCSHSCGTTGEQTRTRTKTRAESCGGSCTYHLSDSKSCNTNKCQNGGTPIVGRCSCTSGWTGTCCEAGEWKWIYEYCLLQHCPPLTKKIITKYEC
jgi:hypothetical protein